MKRVWFKILRFFLGAFGSFQLHWWPMWFMCGDTHYKVKGPETRAVLSKLRRGDILLRRYRNYMTSWFIPGYYTHAAIMVDDETVIHSVTPCVTREDILTFLRCDDVAVLRPNVTPDEIDKGVAEAIGMLGRDYDYFFEPENDKLYCSEVILHCYPMLFPGLEKVVLPEAIMGLDVELIHESLKWRKEQCEA